MVIDDLATTGESKFESIEKLNRCWDEGARISLYSLTGNLVPREALAKVGYQLHAVTTLTDLLDYYDESKKVSADKIQLVREFIQTNR